MDWRHFTRDEFACSHCGENEISTALIDWLDMVRHAADIGPVVVTSGYRCAAHDKAIGGAGVHPTGLAVDVRPAEGWSRAAILLRTAYRWNVSGVGIKGHGDHASRFLHFDLLDTLDKRPWLWTYPR